MGVERGKGELEFACSPYSCEISETNIQLFLAVYPDIPGTHTHTHITSMYSGVEKPTSNLKFN